MSFLVSVIIGVGWLVAGVINLIHGAHWSMILLDAILGIFFLAMAVRKILREAKTQAMEDLEEEKKKQRKKK